MRLLLDPQTMIPRVVGRYSPVFADHGEGIYVWDRDGQRYSDFTSGIAVVNTGHCHPRVVKAIQEQAAKIIHAQQNILAHESMLRAAAEVTATLPESLNQVFWANSGAEAIEGAIKLAKIATRRPAVIAFKGAFHGRTHAAMTLTSSRAKVRGHYEPLLPGVYFAPYPYYFRAPVGQTTDEADDFYIVSCMQSSTRWSCQTMSRRSWSKLLLAKVVISFPSTRWMRELRAICDEHGIMLIMDEIQTGVGRTGKMWGFEHHDVVPDIMTAAKGLGPVCLSARSFPARRRWTNGLQAPMEAPTVGMRSRRQRSRRPCR